MGQLPRSQGYYDALGAAGIEVDPALVGSVGWDPEQAAEAMSRLLGAPRLPTAVYVHSEEMAFGVLRTPRRAGLRVPEDISVVAIDDHPVSALVDLTTVRQAVTDQATSAVRMMMDLIRGNEVERAVVCRPISSSVPPPLPRSS